MSGTVLFVDDEERILGALKRLFLDTDLKILTATNALDGLALLAAHPVMVIVSDNRMPGMKGSEFLEEARRIAPDTIRIMLTGHTDVSSALEAISRGGVYRFMIKPWNDADLKKTILTAIAEYELISGIRNADMAGLLALAQEIELRDPLTSGHCERVSANAVSVGEEFGLTVDSLDAVRVGGWLHDCGKISIPESILSHPGPLSNEQYAILRSHSRRGAEIVRASMLPEKVFSVVLHHHEKFNGEGYPAGLAGDEIPIEARIVTIAEVFDALISDRPYRPAISRDRALAILHDERGRSFDPLLTDIFLGISGGLHGR